MPASDTPSSVCAGVSWWNRAMVGALLRQNGASVRFVETVTDAISLAHDSTTDVFAWASKVTDAEEAACRAVGVQPTFLEDGFLRSVGLGAGLARGGAYVFDRTGIYYDATRPSDIETLLETAPCTADEIARAHALIESIHASGLSKYNVGNHCDIAFPMGRERVLVVGQVAADAGVYRTVSATIDVQRSDAVNRDLLRAARAEFPKAFLIYKPHPDVASGLRAGAIPDDDLRRCADLVVQDVDIVGLIETTDRLVTLSSLSGFEALLRGKPVTVHGMPFYAGWGLTEDHSTCVRRTRRRTRDELAAIALLRYCAYVDPRTGRPCPVEEMVAALTALRGDKVHRLKTDLRRRLSWMGRKLGL